jgi:putative DNA primase/helicase
MMTSDSHPQKENRPGAGRGNHHDDRDKSVKYPHKSIPDELKARPQWVIWRTETRKGKPSKVPYSPTTGKRAKSDTASTWSDFDTALSSCQQDGWEGIGYMFTGDDGLTGIDLDKCATNGQLEPWALEIVKALDSYTEWSPSGAGLHVIVKGYLPPGGRRKGKVEMYDRLRYFTITGLVLPSVPCTIESRQAELEALHARIFDRDTPQSPPRTLSPEGMPDDAELVRRAMTAANGQRFARLWMGDYSGYPSQSEADFSLCQMLAFWTGGDQIAHVGK